MASLEHIRCVSYSLPPPDRGVVCESGRAPAGKSKLMARVREALRSRHYSRRTEQVYCSWVRRFIFFHNVRHPATIFERSRNCWVTAT